MTNELSTKDGSISMWSIGKGEYRIQTNSREVVDNLMRRKSIRRVGSGVNYFSRIFQGPMDHEKASKLFKDLTQLE